MNEYYAHLLQGATLDYARLGLAIKAVIQQRGCTLFDVESQTRVSRASVSRATNGFEISTGPLLLLCIWADLNPFELLRPLGEPNSQEELAGDQHDYRVFHSLQGVKPSEKSRVLRARRRRTRVARAKNG
ncbi:hypothetical protein [uncultured Roseibium sp.]|uniref:hypothetical protein n=1 Tax=uncultured Roseibium sp. TaxID=1936171 RepID=UPI002633F7FA|nr:hypothetical protein [uncultured Roseibium sp.]